MKILHLTEEMFSAGKPFAQGEVLIWMKKFAPKAIVDGLAKLKNLKPMPLEKGMMILGHSETGHHHVLEPVAKKVSISKAAQALVDQANDTFIELKLFQECALVHKRDADTHKAVVLPPGDYIRGIREEQTVDGWVQVAD
jgi:hypothetical protein